MRVLFPAFLVTGLLSAAAPAQLTTRVDPNTGLDVPYRFPVKLDDGYPNYSLERNGRSQVDPIAAYGRCVVDRDMPGSIAYVRAGASGDERRGYKAIKSVAGTCRSLVGTSFLLNRSSVRLSAVADALRARLATQ